jgi:hypothetical protein
MGAVKALAIELQQKQDESGDPHAFIMGMLAVADLILDTRKPYIHRIDEEGCGAWRSLSDAFECCLDSAQYLMRAEPANGPVVD